MTDSPKTRDTGFWRRMIGGVLIGIAFLVPGISGGALAATLGYFEPAIAALSDIRKDFRGNGRYLLPLGIGGVIGAFLAAIALARLLDVAETQAIGFFMGMLAGSLPKLWRDTHPDRPNGKYWGLMACGLAVTVALFFMDNAHGVMAASVTVPEALASGAIFGAGAVVPGISGSFFLIYLGWYKPLIEQIVAFDIPVILATGAGLVAVVLLLVKVANYMFRRHRRATLSVIIGFVTGSLALVLPADFFGSLWWLNCLLFAVGILAGVALGRMEKVE